MFGIVPELRFFPLQGLGFEGMQDLDWGGNPGDVIGVLVVFGVIFLLLILYGVFKGKGSSGGKGGAPRKFNAFTMLRISSAYGLDREQTKLLEYVFRNDGVTDPERVMKNPALIDRLFKKVYKKIERNSETEDDAQQSLLKLFALRNIIEASSANDGNSSKLTQNTPAILAIGPNNYHVKVLEYKGQTITTEMPKNAVGTPIRLHKGSIVSLSFFSKSSSGYSMNCQVVNSVSTPHGLGLQLARAGKAKSLAKRKFRRKQAIIKCEFFFVNLEESGTGKKKVSKLVVDKRRFTGTVQDVSVGGCSLKSLTPVQPGARLKISIDYDDSYQINVLGQVIRINRSGTGGAVIHVKFLKVPRKAFNYISAMVYGYSDT